MLKFVINIIIQYKFLSMKGGKRHNMSFQKRREKYRKKRKQKKTNNDYTITDFFADLFFYVPELIVFPFRVLWYGIRMITKFFDWT
jgi:hypothetical protein